MQSRTSSFIEASTNVGIGYAVSVAANFIILPAFGYDVTVRDSLAIGFAFTAVSLVRSYVLRRIFTKLTESR